MTDIIYEDADILLAHKPAGIPVQTKRVGQKDMVSILKNYRAQKSEEPYIAVVHRLDQPVEGILLFAKTKEAASVLSSQLQEGCMDKYYRAVVCNRREEQLSAGDGGILADYLLKDQRMNFSKTVSENIKGAKKAVLRYEVLKTKGILAEVWIQLETGRHHQIRVQMANAGLPLAGDMKYGWKDDLLSAGYGKNPALCSVKIVFIHPKSGKKMEFETQPKNPVFQLLKE